MQEILPLRWRIINVPMFNFGKLRAPSNASRGDRQRPLLLLVLTAALQHASDAATSIEEAVEQDIGAEGHQHKSLRNTEPVGCCTV